MTATTVFIIENVLAEQALRVEQESAEGITIAVQEDGARETVCLTVADAALLRDWLSDWLHHTAGMEDPAAQVRRLRSQLRRRELEETGLYDMYGQPYK